jgi:hypothetical protein
LFRRTAVTRMLWLLLIIMVAGACKGERTSLSEPDEEQPAVLIRAMVEPEEATIGDVVTYTVTLSRSPDVSVQLPESMDPVQGLTGVEQGHTEPDSSAGRMIETRWFQFRADNVGTVVFPEVKILYPTKQGHDEARTKEIALNVKSVVPENMQDVLDIKPLERPGVDRRIVFYVAAGLFLTALLALAFWLKLKKESGGQTVMPPPLPPGEEAEHALKRLEEMNLIEQGEFKRYYFILSEIFRRYLERRFRVPAIERTSQEILMDLPSMKTDAEVQDYIRTFLLNSDLVKFAGSIPQRQEVAAQTQAFREFLQKTWRVEETTEKEAAHVAF